MFKLKTPLIRTDPFVPNQNTRLVAPLSPHSKTPYSPNVTRTPHNRQGKDNQNTRIIGQELDLECDQVLLQNNKNNHQPSQNESRDSNLLCEEKLKFQPISPLRSKPPSGKVIVNSQEVEQQLPSSSKHGAIFRRMKRILQQYRERVKTLEEENMKLKQYLQD